LKTPSLTRLKGFIGRFIRREPSPAPSPSSNPNNQTEFTAEVVRVDALEPHPNADKLEFVRFSGGNGPMAYQVIAQKGQFAPGDLAGYFGVDCIVPTGRPEFAFLLTRADGAGKTHYRLRAARLRGEFSQGLLVPLVGARKVGEGLAGEFEVTYHVGHEPGGLPTAPGAKRRAPDPMPQYGIESLKKCPRLFEEGEPVLLTEKIHGTNFRFGWVRRRVLGIPFGWKFLVGSHRVIKTGAQGQGWYKEDLWTAYAETHQLAARTAQHKGYFFYGELFGMTQGGARIQDLTYGQAGTAFALFDILGPKGWLDPYNRRVVAADLGMPMVPVVSEVPFNMGLIKLLAEGKSTLDGGTVREGVVVESLSGPRRKAKWVSEGYLLRDEGKHKGALAKANKADKKHAAEGK
jgi:RNA ligase (TIGR02306 family)